MSRGALLFSVLFQLTVRWRTRMYVCKKIFLSCPSAFTNASCVERPKRHGSRIAAVRAPILCASLLRNVVAAAAQAICWPLRYTSKMSSSLSESRTILRVLNKWPSTRPRDSIWKTYLREEYRRSAADAAALDALRRRARDYANLLDGVEEQKRLRALDTGAEVSEGVKEAIRRSAARSGLVAPDDVDAPFVDLNKERNG